MVYRRPSMSKPVKHIDLYPRTDEAREIMKKQPAAFQGVHNFRSLTTRKETRAERLAYANGAGSNIFGDRGDKGFPPQPVIPQKTFARK